MYATENEDLNAWIDFYSPEKLNASTGYRGAAVPVHLFLRELREARKRLATIDAPDVQFVDVQQELVDQAQELGFGY